MDCLLQMFCFPDCDQELEKYMAASSGESRSLSIQLALVALMDKTGYDILQENGQRKYGGPPPSEWR